MTLPIKTSDVSAVLLADGWHEVEPASFTLQRLTFTDADGIEHRKASGKLGYRFLEQCRSLGTLQTVVVAGPVKAILAVRTAAQIPAVGETRMPTPASVPEPPERYEARGTEDWGPAPESTQALPEPSQLHAAGIPPLLQESVPVLLPPFEQEDREPPVPVPASVPAAMNSFEQALTEHAQQPLSPVRESSGRFGRETEQPFELLQVNGGAPSDPVPSIVAEVPIQPEAPVARSDADPERSTPPEVANSSPQTRPPSILLRDEMERNRLAQAGHPVSEGIRLNGLALDG
jgi:hypothetical protein